MNILFCGSVLRPHRLEAAQPPSTHRARQGRKTRLKVPLSHPLLHSRISLLSIIMLEGMFFFDPRSCHVQYGDCRFGQSFSVKRITCGYQDGVWIPAPGHNLSHQPPRISSVVSLFEPDYLVVYPGEYDLRSTARAPRDSHRGCCPPDISLATASSASPKTSLSYCSTALFVPLLPLGTLSEKRKSHTFSMVFHRLGSKYRT